jgi:hypothetical protein
LSTFGSKRLGVAATDLCLLGIRGFYAQLV